MHELFAQGGGRDTCEQCVCVADDTCTGQDDCEDVLEDESCPFVTFEAECGGTFTLKVVMTCTNGKYCETCMGCALLWDTVLEEPVYSIHSTCIEYDCDYEENLTLVSGRSYKLYVCLRSCPEVVDPCEDCESCTVRAYIYKDWDDCNYIPACNP